MRALIAAAAVVGVAALIFGERPKEATIQPFPSPYATNNYQPASSSDVGLKYELEASHALLEANHQARQLEQLQEEVRQLKAQQSLAY